MKKIMLILVALILLLGACSALPQSTQTNTPAKPQKTSEIAATPKPTPTPEPTVEPTIEPTPTPEPPPRDRL